MSAALFIAALAAGAVATSTSAAEDDDAPIIIIDDDDPAPAPAEDDAIIVVGDEDPEEAAPLFSVRARASAYADLRLAVDTSFDLRGEQVGELWLQGGLVLDEREGVTYPDGVQAEDGTIHIIYDHQRTPLGEVLMATFTEEDVRAGKAVTDKTRFREVISSLPITNP